MKIKKLVVSFFMGFIFYHLMFVLLFPVSDDFEKIKITEYGDIKSYIFIEERKTLSRGFDELKISRQTENTFSVDMMDRKRVYMKNPENLDQYKLVQESMVKYTVPKKVAILYMATGRYIKFWDNFYSSMEKYFLPRHEKTYFLFTDHDDLQVPNNVVKIHQDQLPWPYVTLKRFHFFSQVSEELSKFDYIYFLNGTMMPLREINEEIFPTEEQAIMVTLHPGYFRSRQSHRPYDRNRKSKAYIPSNEGEYYAMGGFNGGTGKGFLKVIKTLKEWTDIDLKNNTMPVWHDESLLNRYLLTYMKENGKPLVLLPEYAIPETGHSMVDELRPYAKMFILDKGKYGGHGWLRSSDK